MLKIFSIQPKCTFLSKNAIFWIRSRDIGRVLRDDFTIRKNPSPREQSKFCHIPVTLHLGTTVQILSHTQIWSCQVRYWFMVTPRYLINSLTFSNRIEIILKRTYWRITLVLFFFFFWYSLTSKSHFTWGRLLLASLLKTKLNFISLRSDDG